MPIDTPRGTVFPYTADGTFQKPPWATFIRMICLGGGGGGASGAKGASGTVRAGGGAGGSGGLSIADYLASDLPDFLYVTVGEGVDGGASVTANTTAGNDASTLPVSGHSGSSYVSDAIGDTTGEYCHGYVGGRGHGGAIGPGSVGTGGVGATDGPFLGGAGGNGTSGLGNPGVRGSYSVGGTGGSGLDAANTAQAGTGGWWPSIISARGSIAAGTNGDGTDGANPFLNSPMGGGSGAGGASSSTGDAGAGGMGGYGAGGSGGGAAQNSAGNSGAGGKGGSGVVWIVCW